MNKVEVSGILHNDPELKKTTKNYSLLKLFIKLEEKYPGKDYVKISYIPVVAWGNLADNNVGLKKDDKITIKGMLEFQTWETTQGEKRSQLLVKASEITKQIADTQEDLF